MMIKGIQAKRDVLDARAAFRENWRVYIKYVYIIWWIRQFVFGIPWVRGGLLRGAESY